MNLKSQKEIINKFDKFDIEIFKVNYDNNNNESYKLLKFLKDVSGNYDFVKMAQQEATDKNLQNFLKAINKESSDKTNYDTVKKSSRMFRYVIHGEKHPYGYDGIIWNRHYSDITDNDNYRGEKIETPKELRGFLSPFGFPPPPVILYISTSSGYRLNTPRSFRNCSKGL